MNDRCLNLFDKLGVDFNGTIIRYAVRAKSDGGNGHTITATETLGGAKHDCNSELTAKRKRSA